MVSNKFLAALAVELELYRHLRCGQGTVQASIGDFVQDLGELKKRGNGAMNYWTEAKNPPKVRNLGPYLGHSLKSIQCLADMVESYLGAVFVDSKYDYRQIERFFEVHIKRFFVDMKIYDTFANNHPVVSGVVIHHIALLTKVCAVDPSTQLPYARNRLHELSSYGGRATIVGRFAAAQCGCGHDP